MSLEYLRLDCVSTDDEQDLNCAVVGDDGGREKSTPVQGIVGESENLSSELEQPPATSGGTLVEESHEDYEEGLCVCVCVFCVCVCVYVCMCVCVYVCD